MAGAVFEHILLAEHTEAELTQHEEAIARPSRGALRVWQLKRHKYALDALMRELPSTVDLMVVHDDDAHEAQELVVYCQDKWLGLVGLGAFRSHRRDKSAAAVPLKRRKMKDITVSPSPSKDEEEQSERQEEEQQEEVEEKRVVEKRVEDEEQQSVLLEDDEAAGPEWLPQLRLDLDFARDSTATVLYVLSK